MRWFFSLFVGSTAFLLFAAEPDLIIQIQIQNQTDSAKDTPQDVSSDTPPPPEEDNEAVPIHEEEVQEPPAQIMAPPPQEDVEEKPDVAPPYNTQAPPSPPSPAELLFHVDGSLLYWVTMEDQLQSLFMNSTVEQQQSGSAPYTTIVEDHAETPAFKWNPGVRVVLGVSDADYEVDASWIYMLGRAAGAQGNWWLHYNVFDLLVYREFKLHSVSVNPFCGLVGAQINQKASSTENTPFTSGTTVSLIPSIVKDKQDFWGFGPKIGVEADWRLNSIVSLVGNVGFDLMFSRFFYQNVASDFYTNGNITREHFYAHYTSVQYGLDALFGIRFNTHWSSCVNKTVQFQLSAEHHVLFDHNKMITDFGNLNLDGVSASVLLAF